MQNDSVAASLLPFLEPIQGQLQNWHCRVVPSAADAASDVLRAFPLAKEWRWSSLEEYLQRSGVQTLILQLPAFWQIEPLVHAAARIAGAPLCIVEPGNYPLDIAAIRFASANAITAEALEAAAIADYFIARQIQLPPHWIVVHNIEASNFATPSPLSRYHLHIVEEVHLVPGVPLFERCEDLTAAQSDLWHRSDSFAWSEDSLATISFKGPSLVPITNFSLPFTLEEKGECKCGKSRYRVLRQTR